MHLTVAYLTNRRDCKVEWFLDSFRREVSQHGSGINVRTVMVDFFAEERKGAFEFDFHVPPKPTLWQGKHRRTTKDYFAASNARNTALCLAPDGWLLTIDDLSVLMPGFLKAVREAMVAGYIACGAYKKVWHLAVEKGEVVNCEYRPQGVDSRWLIGRDDGPVAIGGGLMFGCSNCIPTEALLQVNGWDEDCCPMGGEDYICGMMLERSGWSMKYDRRMLTLESEELHHTEKPMIRVIKSGDPDFSHIILNQVLSGQKAKAACYYPEGLREIRRQALAGKPFPVPTQPMNDWRDGQPLSEM
jgi:hypothetical protein